MSLPWVVMLSACIQQVLPGPDLGPCADVPDGTYGYGDAGIGSCIAGPADVQFFEQDGGTFLAVTNADPFRVFRTGSVLVIDWDDVAARLRDDPPRRILTSDLETSAIELYDDDDGDGEGANPYLGGFGYIPGQQKAIVTSRLTEGGVLRSGRDDVYVLDLQKMELPGGGIEVDQKFDLEDDPFPVVVDDANQRAYVGNLTDHSVSVLATDTPPPQDPISVIDVAPGASTTRSTFADVDDSGSLAAVSRLAVTDAQEVIEDAWTLTFVDGSVRVWVPTPLDVSPDLTGLVTHSSGDLQNYIESPFGFETGLGDVQDPFVELDLTTQTPVIWFTRASDGKLYRAAGTTLAGEWIYLEEVLAGGIYGSPSLSSVDGAYAVFAERRDDSEDEDASIVLVTSPDRITYTFDSEVLAPPDDGTSYEDPFVAFDTIAGKYRMWLAVRAPDDTVKIALSESIDGRNWSPPETVLDALTQPGLATGTGEPAIGYAAPTVAVLEGRYGMWVSALGLEGWTHSFAWSYDGRHWTDPTPIIDSEVAFDPENPSSAPRVAVLTSRIGGWRLDGAEQGSLDSLVTAGTEAVSLFGFALEVANGQEVDNTVVDDAYADLGLIPGSAVLIDGREILFATTLGSSRRERIVALERVDGDWSVVIDPDQMDEMLGVLPGEVVSDPVVVADGDGWAMFFTLAGAPPVIRRAFSDDGFDWSLPESGRVLPDDETTFDEAGQFAHSVEPLADGTVRLWFTGDDGSTYQIGAAIADSVHGEFARDPGPTADYQFGTGLPGGFDDSSVRDPVVIDIDGTTHLYYAGLDGTIWHIGHAVLGDDGEFERRTDPLSDLPLASMSGYARTFAAGGVQSPVAGWSVSGDPIEMFYAGLDTVETDNSTLRLGRAIVPRTSPEAMFAAQRFPTAGDYLPFATTRGGPGSQVIELEQVVQEFLTSGYGMSGMALDSERGFLYVTTKLDDTVFVLDVRDDSDGSFVDANALDFEALLQVDSGNAFSGFRDVVVAPSRGMMYLSSKLPDGLVMVDLTRIPDDAVKDEILGAAVAVLPLQSLGDDAGVDTYSQIGGAGMALTPDERFLLITHFRGNALSVFDLDQGAWGEEVAWIPNIGENPHVVRVSPDGRWAVVANYLGDVTEGAVSSTLAIVDLDPTSETYLEAVTWLVNR